MKMRLYQLLLCFLIVNPFWLFAQTEGTDFMRESGKIYVVVAVIAAIFLGIIVFMVYLDRRLTKLENQNKEHDQT